jgi:hypothetical protein
LFYLYAVVNQNKKTTSSKFLRRSSGSCEGGLLWNRITKRGGQKQEKNET